MAQSTIAGVRPETVLTWRVHLARRHPLRAATAAFFVAASAATAYLVWLHPIAAAVVGLLVLFAVAEFLFPIHYRLGPDGAWCRNFLSVRHLAWADVRRCYRDAHGIKLSPLDRRSRLEAYRGIYLWLGGEGDAVADMVRRYLRRGGQR